jgi:signal transduction histidine kinase
VLTNVAKHARATRVAVILNQRNGEVRLIVEDDGAGFDVDTTISRANADRRLGLSGMRERALVLGGSIAIESRMGGGGTTLYALVPATGGGGGAGIDPPQPA